MTKHVEIWCDGSYRREHKTGGIAWVIVKPNPAHAGESIREERQKPLFTLLDSFNHGSDVAELTAFACALMEAPDGSDVLVHMDCKDAIDWLTTEKLSRNKEREAPTVKREFANALAQKRRMHSVEIIYTSDKNSPNMGIAHRMSRAQSSPPGGKQNKITGRRHPQCQ